MQKSQGKHGLPLLEKDGKDSVRKSNGVEKTSIRLISTPRGLVMLHLLCMLKGHCPWCRRAGGEHKVQAPSLPCCEILDSAALQACLGACRHPPKKL